MRMTSRGRSRLRSTSRSAASLLVVLLAVHSLRAFGGSPKLVLNINATPVPASSYPQYLGTVGGRMLFGARDATGPALWSTDGTAQGTALIGRLNVWAQSTFPGIPNFIVVGNRGYFAADDGSSGIEPWSTDGTAAGTTLLADLAPGTTASNPSFLGTLGSELIFSATDASGARQMYVSDGTTAGTQALTSFTGQNFGVASDFQLSDNLFLILGSKFYFVQEDSSYSWHIWASDGTSGGTREVTIPSGNNNSDIPHGFTAVGQQVLFEVQGLLWSIDTTTDQITAVTATGGTDGFGPPNVVENIEPVALNGVALFIGTTGVFAPEQLWRSDGTDAGTYSIATIATGPPSNSSPLLLRLVGGRVLFIGQDAQYGYQLWSSDGTSANTVRLTNASEPANVVFPIAVYAATLAGTAYFSLPDGAQTTTWSLWRTDGTPAGTRRVSGLPPIDQSEVGLTRVTGDATSVYVSIWNPDSTTPVFKYDPVADVATPLKTLQIGTTDGFLDAAGNLYFSSDDPVIGDEPWFSDGTPAGTHLIADLNPQTTDNGSNPDEFVDFGGTLAFVADDGVHGRELWKSDGTAAGTALLADINPGAASSNPNHLFVANGALYFFATDASGTQKLMRLASLSGTVQTLATLSPPSPVSLLPFPVVACSATTPVVLNGGVYFSATDGTSGQELWTTDGTAAGTHLVADINPGGADANPCLLTVFGNRIYFAATGPGGNELWSSDGTASGTAQVADISPGSVGSSPGGLLVFNGRLYFTANDGVNGAQVWTSDGTSAGTRMLTPIVPNTGGSVAGPIGALPHALLIAAVVFQEQPLQVDVQLWGSDGTAAGTGLLGNETLGQAFVDTGTAAYFSSPGSTGPEPWITDGTANGTHLLAEINPTAATNLIWFENFNGIALFAVTDPSFGERLWRSDGTSSGTTLVGTIPPEPSPAPVVPTSPARHRLTVGQTFFFVGSDPQSGAELYALANESPVAVADTASSANDQPVTINVLANDSDPDGTLNSSTVRIVTQPSHGTASVASNGVVTYTPTTGFSGTDSFTYTVNDNQGAPSNAATVTITVTAPPTTAAAAAASHGGGGAIGLLDILALLGYSVFRRARAAGA